MSSREQATMVDNYPPHSIVKTDENTFRVELAVAGFSEEELTINLEKQKLTVDGKKAKDDREYLHKGISTRKFSRTFRLNDNVVVKGANLNNGILEIDLEIVVPEEHKPKQIPIQKVGQQQLLCD